MPDRHMWSADVAALSVDGWQPNEDAVVMRSQRLVTNVPPDTVDTLSVLQQHGLREFCGRLCSLVYCDGYICQPC